MRIGVGDVTNSANEFITNYLYCPFVSSAACADALIGQVQGEQIRAATSAASAQGSAVSGLFAPNAPNINPSEATPNNPLVTGVVSAVGSQNPQLPIGYDPQTGIYTCPDGTEDCVPVTAQPPELGSQIATALQATTPAPSCPWYCSAFGTTIGGTMGDCSVCPTSGFDFTTIALIGIAIVLGFMAVKR